MVGFRKLLLGAMSVLAVLAAAPTATPTPSPDNSIITPGWGQVANADDVLKITWKPTTSGNVNLILRSGGAESLSVLYTIASNIPNSGSYTWNIPAKQGSNTDYSIEISPVDNSGDSNFSPYFTILAVGQGVTSSGTDSATTATTSAGSSTSGSASASTSASTSAAESSSGSASASVSASKTSASGSTLSTKASSSATKAETSESTSASTSASTTAATTAATTGAAAIQPANAAVAFGAAVGVLLLGTL